MLRATVAGVCLLSMVGLPTAALATPPDHAPAHGHHSRDRDSSRSVSSTQGADSTVTADAGTKPRDRRSAKGPDGDKASGRRAGTTEHPGQGHARGRPPESSPASADPAPPTAPATPREPVPSDQVPARPAVVEPGAASQASAPAASTPTPSTDRAPALAAVPAPTDPVPAPARGVAPGLGQIGQNFADLLDGVANRVADLRVAELGPAVTEPVARLVPLLLALLGAFLAVQRGIGRGLGHVPMVVTSSYRRDVDASI